MLKTWYDRRPLTEKTCTNFKFAVKNWRTLTELRLRKSYGIYLPSFVSLSTKLYVLKFQNISGPCHVT